MVSSGLLCIGDAAHAMSPVGGVGINLAIQDAMAAANALPQALRTKQLAFPFGESVVGAQIAADRHRKLLPVGHSEAPDIGPGGKVNFYKHQAKYLKSA
jgi:hypothetical protein